MPYFPCGSRNSLHRAVQPGRDREGGVWFSIAQPKGFSFGC